MTKLTGYGLFYIFIALNFAHGQSIPTVMICSESSSVPQRFGKIVRRNEEPGGLCEVQLPAPSSSHMIITGVTFASESSPCDSLTLTMDGSPFCIVEGNYHPFSSASFAVSSPTDADFTITYYDTVFRCGERAQPQVTLSQSVWSGVISSPQLLKNNLPSQGTCNVKVTGLPAHSAISLQQTGAFKPSADLKITVINQNLQIDGNNRDIIITADSNGDFEIQSSAVDDSLEYVAFQYLLIYNLIRCGNIPMINDATHVETDPPYLPDTTVQYQCVDNYQFRDKSSITCVSNGTDASWDSNVKCIPVPWCVDNPATIENSDQVVVALNRTVEYQCKDGYESPDGLEPISISCSTSDNDTTAWTWNDTNIRNTFSCVPVQCNVTELTVLANVTIATAKETVDYMETVDYVCDEGFTKQNGDVTCQSDKTWSDYRLCEEVRCDILYLINASMAPSTSLSSLPYGTVLNISCDPGYQLLNGGRDISITCSIAGIWNVTIPNNSNAYDRVVQCSKIPGVQQHQTTTEKLKGDQQQVVIVGSVLGVVCILLIGGLVFFVIKSRKLSMDMQRLTASGKAQQFVTERSTTNGTLYNPTEYEEVGSDVSQINPAVDFENINQANNETNTYENSGTRMAGNIQSRGAEYEMVNQGEGVEDNHVYTSLNN